MGTFHDGLGELHGITVVVDTKGTRIAIGRCHTVTESKVMTIKNKDVQGYVGDISPADMKLLGKSTMPSRF